MNSSVGLSKEELGEIIKVLEGYPEIHLALLFGSRAKGTFRNASDVDIALKGGDISHSTINTVRFKLNEESVLPYHFDVIHYETLLNSDLKEHIDRVGICIYSIS